MARSWTAQPLHCASEAVPSLDAVHALEGLMADKASPKAESPESNGSKRAASPNGEATTPSKWSLGTWHMLRCAACACVYARLCTRACTGMCARVRQCNVLARASMCTFTWQCTVTRTGKWPPVSVAG